jgi:hypothetical protein
MNLTGLNHPDKWPENQYKKGFFKTRYKYKWRAPIICGAVKKILNPKSVIDIGCATGDLVAAYPDLGITAKGIEGSKNCLDFLECDRADIFILDLRIPIVQIPEKFDLATCFEVAEHIEPEYADIFTDNLCSFSDKILMSAALPGMRGHHHYNCQPAEYWNDKFKERGYYSKSEVVKLFKTEWISWKRKPGIKAYYENLLYFEK